jgi:hypothetical protein
MEIFAIVIFGLATIRTITPFTKNETYSSLPIFIGSLGVCVTMCICYIWFLKKMLQ